jgi:hypothetical protein
MAWYCKDYGKHYTDKGPAAVDDAATRGHTDLMEPWPPGGGLVAGTWTANKRCVGGAELMNDTRMRELYSSPNGDRWHLCKDASGRVFVLHQANIPSGGQTSQIELGHFLTRGYGPEQQALFQMIGTLIESTPGELLTGEGNPGLAVTGGSGHA